MNHCVPDFEIDEDDSVTTSSALNRSKKSSMANEEIMELLWQNGQLVTHSQNQRSLKKSSQVGGGGVSEQREIRSEEETTTSSQHQLFMQEDEMASWLQYPLDLDRDFYADLLYPPAGAPPPPPTAPVVSTPPRLAVTGALRPPVPPQRRLEPPVESRTQQQKYYNFSHFSRPKGRIQSGPSNLKESTTVESNETPMTTALESRVSCVADNATQVSGGNLGCSVTTAPTNTSPVTCDLTVTSSPGGSGASVSAEPSQKVTTATTTTTEDRKRKGREADESECQSEDVEFESAHAKKQVCGSSTKRSRAAEVHNLSERRRRDRINEKMKALQELIPRCNKSDKASMLDEAIEYLKSLQMQVQMMSMGCGMVPMMYPGIQQYMPGPMGMGMGMGMSMDMGMNRPMVPFPSVLPRPALPNPAAAAHLAPRFPMPGFHMSPVPIPDPSRIQANGQTNFVDPYQQYLGLRQAQVSLPQNRSVMQPSPSKPSTSREGRNPDNRQSG